MKLLSSWLPVLPLLLLLGCADEKDDDDDDDDEDTTPAAALLAGLDFGGFEVEEREGPPPDPNDSPIQIQHLIPDPEPLLISPGGSGALQFAYFGAVDYTEVEVIISFDDSDTYLVIVVQIDSVSGEIVLPFSVDPEICDNLEEVYHDITCSEALQGYDDTVTEYLTALIGLECSAGTTETDPTDDTGTTGEYSFDTEMEFFQFFADNYCPMAQECSTRFSDQWPEGVGECQDGYAGQLDRAGYSWRESAVGQCASDLVNADWCADYVESWGVSSCISAFEQDTTGD